MIIRNGNYTILNGYECALFEVRQESPIPFTHFVVKWYLERNCPLQGFELNEHGDMVKIFKKGDVKNAYYIETKGSFKGDEFLLWGYDESRDVVGLITLNRKLAEEHCFLKLSDRYIKEVNPKELDSIWEETNKSKYNLPVPDSVKKKKYLT